MNIINETVLCNIYNDLLEISSLDMQRELWLGRSLKGCSSFVEVICRLFDDNSFTLFVTSSVNEIGFSAETINKLRLLHDELEGYVEFDADTINDPEWQKITFLALNVIDLWNLDKTKGILKF